MNINTTPNLEMDPRIEGFSIQKKASTNIEFFGSNYATGQMFFQFRNGTTYIYNGVPVDVMRSSVSCDSIGKFFHAMIKGQFESEGIGERLVREEI